MPSTRAPALLTMAHYAGTLAAARCLGSHGVPVVVATDRLLGAAAWSRSVSRRVRCPSIDEGPGPMLEWLLAFGEREPGAVLYPTSDEMAWLVARYEAELRRNFRLYSPPGATLTAVLDKVRLYEACRVVGIDAPRTWLPADEAAVERMAGEAEAFVVKPRTQTFFARHAKGDVVRGRAELLRCWRSYYDPAYARAFSAEVPGLELPMVQEYLSGAEKGVHSVTGFVDKAGRLLVSMGSLKVVQHPKRVGIGVCFESVDPPAGLGEKVAALCSHLGYFGIFEAEFVREGDRWLLIDFNPRYFGQMGFDVARGAPLPWLCHLAALGAEEEAREAVASLPQAGPRVYRDRVALLFRLGTAGAVGGMSPDEIRRWRGWLRDQEGEAADASFERSDPLPAVAAALGMVWNSAQHPRAFWRSLRAQG